MRFTLRRDLLQEPDRVRPFPLVIPDKGKSLEWFKRVIAQNWKMVRATSVLFMCFPIEKAASEGG